MVNKTKTARTKVAEHTQDNMAVCLEEHVAGLEVTMDDFVGVQMGQRLMQREVKKDRPRQEGTKD